METDALKNDYNIYHPVIKSLSRLALPEEEETLRAALPGYEVISTTEEVIRKLLSYGCTKLTVFQTNEAAPKDIATEDETRRVVYNSVMEADQSPLRYPDVKTEIMKEPSRLTRQFKKVEFQMGEHFIVTLKAVPYSKMWNIYTKYSPQMIMYSRIEGERRDNCLYNQ